MILSIQGAEVYLERQGHGAKALLLHGWGGKSESWLPVLRDFQGSLDMAALDFPGHGRSSDPPAPWSVAEYMEMTAELMRREGLQGAHIIAHSFGGRVALALAATYPELVGKLVLTGVPAYKTAPNPAQSKRTKRYRRLRKLGDNPVMRGIFGDKLIDRLVSALQKRFGSADYAALSADMRRTFVRIVEQDLSGYIPKIAAPTLLFWGKTDTAAPLWMGEKMAREMPDAGLVAVDGGHFAYLDQYPTFRAVLNNFLATEDNA